MKTKKKKKLGLFDAVNTVILLMVLLVIIYPLYYTIIASFSSYEAVAAYKVVWRPVDFSLDAYKTVFENKQIWVGYANSIYYTLVGTMFNLFLTIPAAYSMSKKYLPYKNVFTTLFLISMYFGGGMVPTYLLVKSLGLIDTRTILVIIGGLSVYNMIMTKTYFQNSIPESLYEAAEIDGAGEIRKFLSIALPLAKPIIAVMFLYYAVNHWNSYFSALIYTNSRKVEPLQLVLRRILLTSEALPLDFMNDLDMALAAVEQQQLAYVIKYAVVFIGSAPMLIAYPFVQKYFVKGAMIGSVKG